MMVYFWPNRDRMVCLNYFKCELKKFVLKSLLASFLFPIQDKFYWSIHFHKFSKNSSISFHRNYCLRTKTGRSIFRLFRLSRHCSKNFASNGYLIGMRKSSF